MTPQLLDEAINFITYDVVPKLVPSICGNFQVVLLGLYRNHAEIGINLVNPNKEVLKYFGKQVVPIGGAVVIDDFSSIINIGIPITAYFQAWVIGINKENTQAEISLRLVDENRKELKNFGSKVKNTGQTITLEGLSIKVNIIPGH